MKHEYQKHLPKGPLSPRLAAKREYLYAKRYDAPAKVIERLERAWKRLENDK